MFALRFASLHFSQSTSSLTHLTSCAMAPLDEHGVTTVLSTKVLSHDERSILVEVGGFTPMQWFLEHGLRPESDEEDGEPPKKRRKTNETTSVKAVTPSVNSHILVSRVSLDLQFLETINGKSATPMAVDTFEPDVAFEDAASIAVIPSVIDLFEDGMRLRLALPRKKGAVMLVDTAGIPDRILDALRKNAVSRKQRHDARTPKNDAHPATWTRCSLTRSHGQLHTVVRLEASLFWRSGASAFPAGVPVGKARVYPDYDILAQAFPDGKRDNTDHLQKWAPHDFYDSVHVPDKEIDTKGHFDSVLESELYPFQKRAVHWMLKREGTMYKNGGVSKLSRQDRPRNVSFYQPSKDATGDVCHVNHLQGIIQRQGSEDETTHLSGGLLAEEMGLGKTVELMALLSLHRRPELMPEKVVDADSGTDLTPSRATLIITPASILQQWKSELSRHAPALKVLQYEGVASNKAKAEQQMISDMTSKYDVILATYRTLAREVHFAEDPPERDMRRAPKFKRKRSPLVRIQWWRICLDEAQMVDSGVTAAARVACRLPRVHSWAVSGTPLRKNVEDLHGLLIFLQYKPLSDNAKLWSHLITNHRHLFRQIFGGIALRHTKAQIREDLHLPPQKRVVITVPFSAIEQQHYSTLFSQMCEAVGVQNDGTPRDDQWDPEDPGTMEAMRSFLTRLRQTCLHPQVGGKNRKALGRGQGPLRTVAEVLEVMIDQNETNVRVEERALLASQLVRAHILGNAREDDHRSEKALEIYLSAAERSGELVEEARSRLAVAKQAQAERGEATVDTDDEDSSSESTPLLGRMRNNLRTALQLQHSCTFFAATAYFQIKSNETLTKPDSDGFKEVEEREMSHYEKAKVIRREILKDTSRKSESLMRKIRDLKEKGGFAKMPGIKDLDGLGGIESRRIVEKSDELFDTIRDQARVVVEWRAQMAKFLLKPLVDEDEGIETTGDEYEDSTKLQDELYAYFDAVKAMQADMNTFVTGEDAPLIDHEVTANVRTAKMWLDPKVAIEVKEQFASQIHAPELTLELLASRNKFRAQKEDIGSVRGLIQQARGLENSLQWHESGTRAAERTIVHRHLSALQSIFSSYTKALNGLEKEIDLFRSTQNQRLEFYRQLQELSDAVQPHKEELDKTLDLASLQTITDKEDDQTKSLAQLKTKNRFLLHLRDDTGSQSAPKICVICQCTFESGVLTICGHQYCKECIQHWWNEHRSCPVCKRKLSMIDFHNITYKPQELRAQEEVQSGSSSPSEASPSQPRSTSIYSDVDNQLMQEIKSIDLPSSYGTKIDTLGRHLHWIREHDPGAKSIVFSIYREFLDVLGTALHDFKIGYSRLGRAGAAEKFKNNPSVDCLLLDAKTDSSGLTLVNATHVFICEPLIQTAVELQAIARVHRIGQTRPTTVWMYLINDTVEEAIYEISVARRLAHVQSRQSHRMQKSRSTTPAPLAENAIDAANSEEMQSAPISKLLVAGKGGGELVGNDDLWQCLFGKTQKTVAKPSVEMETVVARHLRAEAGEQRRLDAAAGAQS